MHGLVRYLFLVCVGLASLCSVAFGSGLAVAAPPAAADGVEEALAWLNGVRQAAGAPPVTLDSALSADATAHARYMVLNNGHPALAGLGSHDQDPSLPGASSGGRAAAAASNIYPWARSVLAAVQGLTGVPLHRRGMLDPLVHRVGIGAWPHERGGFAVVVDVIRGVDRRASLTERPLVYPAPGQSDVPVEFGGEIPDPRDATPGKGQPGGYSITVEPSCGRLSAPARVQLRDDAGRDVPHWIVNPGTVLTAVGGSRTVSQVIVLSQQPLEGGTTYQVVVGGRCNDREYSAGWSFTTTGRRLPRNAQGEYEVRVPELMDFATATDWAKTYLPTQLNAGVVLSLSRAVALPDDAHRLVARPRVRVEMADGGPVDLRLLRPVRTSEVGGVRVADYEQGPQFLSEFRRQQAAGRWSSPVAPAIEDGAWVLRFARGAEIRWRQGASEAIVVPPCGFQLGFEALQASIPAQVGECLEHERFNPANGNAEQRTTGGLLVWRKADNWTAFTDGYRTWLSGPFGVQERLNEGPRFDWEQP
jgi:uncharacterized protein YkwD